MLAVVRDRAIHHAADQFHVALLFRFDRPCHERQRVLRATLNCAGLRRALTADLSVYGARGRSICDATLGLSKDRRVPAQRSRQAGKVPEPGKGTNRTEGRERDPPRVLDHASPGRLVSAHRSDLLSPWPQGGSGMTCPRCQQDNPSHAKFCLECGVHLRGTGEDGPSGAPYAELQRALTEALEQQTATAEILSVISGSPTDIRPVFAAVLDRALTLCEASNGSIYQFEDGVLRHVGLRGPHLGIEVGGVFPLESSPGRAILEKRTVHLEDILQELDWHAPEVQAGIQRAGLRTIVAVPLLCEETAIGAIVIRRLEVRPFSEKQIRLLKTFADQAVIAIENVRLFKDLQASNRELTTALDKQTATSDILRVISRSQTDIQPVFDTIVQSAVRLLGGHTSVLSRTKGDQIEVVAFTSTDETGDAIVRASSARPLNSEEPHAWVMRNRVPLNYADAHTDRRLPEAE